MTAAAIVASEGIVTMWPELPAPRYTINDAVQGSQEWREARAGRATGSRAGDIVATIKTGEAAARRDYRVELVTERLSGSPSPDGYRSEEMRWGTDTEPYARMAYESRLGVMVTEAGFAIMSDYMAGCSVDGFIEGGGLLEIKCPKSATHIKWLQGKRLPPEHLPQVLHNLWVTGEPFADFVSFDPRLPDNLQFFRMRFEADAKALAAYETALLDFLEGVSELEDQLRRYAA